MPGSTGWSRSLPATRDTVRSIMFDPLSPEQLTQFGDICQTILASMETSARKAFDLPAESPAGRLAD